MKAGTDRGALAVAVVGSNLSKTRGRAVTDSEIVEYLESAKPK